MAEGTWGQFWACRCRSRATPLGRQKDKHPRPPGPKDAGNPLEMTVFSIKMLEIRRITTLLSSPSGNKHHPFCVFINPFLKKINF
jgi:hypothetical protein